VQAPGGETVRLGFDDAGLADALIRRYGTIEGAAAEVEVTASNNQIRNHDLQKSHVLRIW